MLRNETRLLIHYFLNILEYIYNLQEKFFVNLTVITYKLRIKKNVSNIKYFKNKDIRNYNIKTDYNKKYLNN